MSNTPVQEPPAQRLSSGSGQTLPSRPLQPISDPSASKRVCFYKSGDYKFSGHRIVINARTFKTFDALLDALSKKVPLPFGVRTITTPRGTHSVKGLDDLHDGGSYVCSDQKRVKPLNLNEVNRRQVPWNTTRPFSAARRSRRQGAQFGRSSAANNRPAKVTERVAVRTPKRLVVIKNKDPSVKRTIVLHRRTAPTFDALLDYLSQILQFPVLKLFSTDGRRVDGLAALILCSGVVVAAGNEPFRLGNYGFHSTGHVAQTMYMETVEPSVLQPRALNNKSFSSGRGSRNFSLSSERYIVNQINKSRNGSTNSHMHQHNGSSEEVNPPMEVCGAGRVDTEHHTCIVPQDDDIEKSFRVNQDGSMTVEMKVRLTIKEEEMLQWTTTLSRSSLIKRTVCASISESGNNSPNSNNAVAKDSSSISEDETKEENHPNGDEKGVSFNDAQVYGSYTSTALGKAKKSFKRTPTPGPRFVKKKASVESVKMVTDLGVQENTVGHYSYMERTADGESTEGYCIVRHNSSSNNRPIPKPRTTASAGASNKGSNSSIRSSGVAEVLQIQNNGMEVTETVMHIYESQGCYDNFFANEDYSTDGVPLHDSPQVPDSKPSTESGPRSSSNDIDFSWQPPTADSLQRQEEEMLSLSSEPVSSAHNVMNNLSPVTENEAQAATNAQTVKTVKKNKSDKNSKMIKPARNHKSSLSTSNSDKKQKESIINPTKNSKHSSTDKNSSNASVGKKSLSSSESAKNGQQTKRAEKPQPKKSVKEEKTTRKEEPALLFSSENVKRTPPKRQNINKAAAKDNGHNANTSAGRSQIKKNFSDFLQPKKSPLPGKKKVSKPKSMTENRIPSPKQTLELNESVSMPSLNPTPSEIHQYVESWLEKVSPDQVPYTEETIPDDSEPQSKVVFQIGGDSEMDENSESQNNLNEYYSQPADAVKKSASCLSVPLFNEGPATSLLHSDQKTRGLCVSMPTVRVDPVPQESRLRAHKSAEVIGPAESESSSSNILSPKAKIKPVLRQLCSSIQCIRRVSDTKTSSGLEKSSSLPDFSTQVALVFGSSCKAFLSFLSVMTLRDSLTGSQAEDSNQSRSTSEAMLMMESLQKISAIDDEEEQKASLTDLQSRASSDFRERWKDFLILRERLESEPHSPRISETEFALDVVSEGGDVFEDQHVGIDELMEELNMPEDLRAEITSTIQQSKSFYPVEESTFVETERNLSDSEEDVEKFVEECNNETNQSPEVNSACTADGITEKEQGNNGGDVHDLIKTQSVYSETLKTMWESEQAALDVKDSDISQTERDEPINYNDNESEDKECKVEEDMNEENEEQKEIYNVNDEELENIGKEREMKTEEEEVKTDEEGQDEWESDRSVEKVEERTEEEMTVDEEEEGYKLEKEVDETENGKIDEEGRETRQGDSAEETDERECDQETEEEEKGDECGSQEMQAEVGEETDKEEEEENNEKQEKDKKGVGADDSQEAENDDDGEEVIEGETVDKTEEQDEREKKEKGEEGEAEAIAEYTFDDEVEMEEEEQIRTNNLGEIEEVGVASEGHVQEDAEEVVEETEEEEEVQNMIDESVRKEEVDGDLQEEADEDIEETEEEEEEQNMIDESEEKEQVDEAIEGDLQEEAEEDIEETEEEEEEQNIIHESEEKEQVDEATEGDLQEEAEEDIEETEEEEEEQNIIHESEEKEQVDEDTEGDLQEEAEEDIEETEEEDEVQSMSDEIREEEEVDVATEGDVQEEAEKHFEETDEKKEVENSNVKAYKKEGEEEMGEIVKESDEEPKTGVVSEEEDENTEEGTARVNIDEEENKEATDNEEIKCDEVEDNREELEETSLEDSAEEIETGESKTEGQILYEEEREDELKEGFEHVDKQESNYEVEEENVSEDADTLADCKNLRDTVSYLQQQRSSCDEANVGQITESPTKYFSDVQCEDDKGNGTDSVNELETEEGGENHAERHSSQPHLVEISQELLDFVNSALQTSSLIFTYDSQGNFRIEADNARVVQTKQIVIPKSSSDSLYGLNCLPSPSTSDLSDYRPETSESGGYKTQESVDIVSESGEEASEKPFPIHRLKTNISSGRTNVEQAKSTLSVASNSEALDSSRLKSAETSYDSASKASREDLSYFSAASSLKADGETAPEATQCILFTSEKNSADGVLIDQGRWLLKENHLIRKSPPISLGMYGNLDSTSIDTVQENTSEDSPPHYKTQHNPLAVISSSELEEMAKPQTPKCTYYNMPHGSDSDPFLDDSSIKSGKKDTSSFKGRSSRVSPTVDTSKTWANKNGSLSSFASVEFKLPDRKVHPEGESSAVTQARRTSSGGGSALQAQDSLNTLRVRCGQYCPIL